MTYKRPHNELCLTKEQKSTLIEQYFDDYLTEYQNDKSVLNRKLPRGEFADLLDELGGILVARSKSLAVIAGPVRTFLEENELPRSIGQHLPLDFRVFCLALNAMKQWVAAEQSATDCYLLGREARKLCREAAECCLVCREELDTSCELHHPIRDGRPPIPLSKRGHAKIEKQLPFDADDPVGLAISGLRRKGNRSWVQLRRGCLDWTDQPQPESSKRSAANNRTFAKNAAEAAKITYEKILEWLDRNELGYEQ